MTIQLMIKPLNFITIFVLYSFYISCMCRNNLLYIACKFFRIIGSSGLSAVLFYQFIKLLNSGNDFFPVCNFFKNSKVDMPICRIATTCWRVRSVSSGISGQILEVVFTIKNPSGQTDLLSV